MIELDAATVMRAAEKAGLTIIFYDCSDRRWGLCESPGHVPPFASWEPLKNIVTVSRALSSGARFSELELDTEL